jgi:Killing trait
MADPTLVNGQVTDSVTQANVKVLGDAPAVALGTSFQAHSQSTGLAMQNAVSAQHHMTTIGSTVTTQAVNLIFSIPVAAGVRGTNAIFGGNALGDTLIQLRSALNALS